MGKSSDEIINDAHYVFDFKKSKEENLRAFSKANGKNGKPLLTEEQIQNVLRGES